MSWQTPPQRCGVEAGAYGGAGSREMWDLAVEQGMENFTEKLALGLVLEVEL